MSKLVFSYDLVSWERRPEPLRINLPIGGGEVEEEVVPMRKGRLYRITVTDVTPGIKAPAFRGKS